MKVKIEGKNPEDVIPFLPETEVVLDDRNPDLIITYGGDGALLSAERLYPGIPKFPLREHRTAPLCPDHGIATQIRALLDNRVECHKLIKLEGIFHDRRILAINDIFIHNLDPVNAIRYRVWIDNELYANEIVGDGIGMATIHGSTAYYRSITHSIFRVGIGLAFNNSTELVNHLVLPEKSQVRIKILRGPALMAADNSTEKITLQENDEVLLRKAKENAVVLGLKNFMCEQCRLLRHPNKFTMKNLRISYVKGNS